MEVVFNYSTKIHLTTETTLRRAGQVKQEAKAQASRRLLWTWLACKRLQSFARLSVDQMTRPQNRKRRREEGKQKEKREENIETEFNTVGLIS